MKMSVYGRDTPGRLLLAGACYLQLTTSLT